MSDVGEGLSAVPLPTLEALLEAVKAGEVSTPLNTATLQARGFGRHADTLLPALAPFESAAAAAVLRLIVAERTRRQPPSLKLVWTGPDPKGTVARNTAVIVRELFSSARETVLIGGFRFSHGADLFQPLHAAMAEQGVETTIFLDIEGAADNAAGSLEFAERAVDRFFHDNWPFGRPQPTLYFDPRTAAPGPPWVSLHAKCIVVDTCRALLTSANFTHRGQRRNIEAGVLIDDALFAHTLTAQWRRLVDTGGVVIATPSPGSIDNPCPE